jgi:hypothetical protein
MLIGVVRRLVSRPVSAGLALILTTAGSGAAMAQSSSRPPAGQPASAPPVVASAEPAKAPSAAPASRPSISTGSGGGYNPGGNSGGGGFNPGNNTSGNSGGSGYNPGGNSGGGGYNPGGNTSGNSGGSGYNPGSNSNRPDYGHSGGHNSGGAWNGVTGEGWNPGNYYQRSVIQGWIRLGFASAGKGADKDIIQAYGNYRYSRIKLCVRVADVAFYDAQVQFEHGGRQDIRVQSRVKRGQCTREYYLRGGKRLDIRYVYLFFRQADNITNWRSAQVDLYAR